MYKQLFGHVCSFASQFVGREINPKRVPWRFAKTLPTMGKYSYVYASLYFHWGRKAKRNCNGVFSIYKGCWWINLENIFFLLGLLKDCDLKLSWDEMFFFDAVTYCPIHCFACKTSEADHCKFPKNDERFEHKLLVTVLQKSPLSSPCICEWLCLFTAAWLDHSWPWWRKTRFS